MVTKTEQGHGCVHTLRIIFGVSDHLIQYSIYLSRLAHVHLYRF